MNKIKNEKGVITIIVLLTLLFIIAFLITTYVSISNKAQTEVEITQKIKKQYNNLDEAGELYNSYVGGNLIEIYTADQFLCIGSGSQIEINGVIYTFSDDKIYVLMNDLQINLADHLELINSETGWIPIGETDYIFEGNNHVIEVTDLDGNIIYCTKENHYTGQDI